MNPTPNTATPVVAAERVFRKPFQSVAIGLPPILPKFFVSEFVWVFDGKVTGLGYLNDLNKHWHWCDHTRCEAVAWAPATAPVCVEARDTATNEGEGDTR